ncbi:hypothetical protein [Parvularcula dongshanensis]|uniref:Uncharacterized protein n=1 Tax=Parvularcula dongshanensis TaxID=1173995 RepID=A0A840I4B3_9PROT|nr:hypothetical protein [Parvularcula dongshanensis]MBB4659044.1 hypothetical protein [Parvularcula dongshanensis]
MANHTPYEQLRAAIHDYGDAAMENFLRSRAFGLAVVEGFAAYLGCDPSCVSAVPAEGPFDPAKDYGDQAFGFDPAKVIRLEPVTFGVCVTVPHEEDSGSLWLRTGVRVEVTGDTFDVFVANQPMIRVPLEFEDQLTPVHEALHRELMSLFRRDLATFRDERYEGGIGFMP